MRAVHTMRQCKRLVHARYVIRPHTSATAHHNPNTQHLLHISKSFATITLRVLRERLPPAAAVFLPVASVIPHPSTMPLSRSRRQLAPATLGIEVCLVCTLHVSMFSRVNLPLLCHLVRARVCVCGGNMASMRQVQAGGMRPVFSRTRHMLCVLVLPARCCP